MVLVWNEAKSEKCRKLKLVYIGKTKKKNVSPEFKRAFYIKIIFVHDESIIKDNQYNRIWTNGAFPGKST